MRTEAEERREKKKKKKKKKKKDEDEGSWHWEAWAVDHPQQCTQRIQPIHSWAFMGVASKIRFLNDSSLTARKLQKDRGAFSIFF